MHISTECYPAAKAGGMGDVVGALPIYLPEQGINASVVIPRYKRIWFDDQEFIQINNGDFLLGNEHIFYKVLKLDNDELEYPFYCIEIPGKFDRENIYLGEDGHGYRDEVLRNIAFQTAVLEWLISSDQTFGVLHCHDHMTGLITFFVRHSPKYKSLKNTPTVLTIHNGQYRGEFDWFVAYYFPLFNEIEKGLLDWDNRINSLAAAIKCAWHVNTVSPAYMQEISQDAGSLTSLYASEGSKCSGIINGIDNVLWDPATDLYLNHTLQGDWAKFKKKNKKYLIDKYKLKSRRLIIGFIGRLAYQKGADLLAAAVNYCLEENMKIGVVILGSGDKDIEYALSVLSNRYPREVGVTIGYDEALARKIYAGSDFLIMPSRFEPCGLNQMYAMRYGTIPIVAHVGGLKDTVPDYEVGGNGIVYHHPRPEDIVHALKRAVYLYNDKSVFLDLRTKITGLNFSWSKSSKAYAKIYKRITK